MLFPGCRQAAPAEGALEAPGLLREEELPLLVTDLLGRSRWELGGRLDAPSLLWEPAAVMPKLRLRMSHARLRRNGA